MKRNQTEQTCEGRNKIDKYKLGFLGSRSRMQEQACMRRQDYAYAVSCPENLKTHKQSRTLKQKSNNLTCIKHEKDYKTNLNRHTPT